MELHAPSSFELDELVNLSKTFSLLPTLYTLKHQVLDLYTAFLIMNIVKQQNY